jgi:2-C-methyl-D-erythritol 4-phosphate cytidylyltransferase
VTTAWAVVVAGGSGSRFGSPKQFALLGGRPVVEWAVEACRGCCDGVVLVLPEDAAAEPTSSSGQLTSPGRSAPNPAQLASRFGADVVVGGGPTRSASVRRGLAAVPPDAEVVVVHDAARPFASPALFEAVLEALLGSEEGEPPAGAICAVAVTDTLKRVDPERGTVARTLDRDDLVAVQTPQAFRADVLRRAHAAGGHATDDAALVEALGATVRVVAGDQRNLKLTTPADLALAEHLLGC